MSKKARKASKKPAGAKNQAREIWTWTFFMLGIFALILIWAKLR